jgi:hypothetical protein
MKNNDILYGQPVYIHPLVRWCYATYLKSGDEDSTVTDYSFEVYRRPFLWGRLGRKKWEGSIRCNDFEIGRDFSFHLIAAEMRAYNKKHPPEDIFEWAYIESLGYEIISDDGKCGSASSKMPKGKRVIYYNRGTTANWLGIREDGDTRSAFNGIIESRGQLELILRIVK